MSFLTATLLLLSLVQVAKGQVTVCPSPQLNGLDCGTCPNGWTPCKYDFLAGITYNGGCSPVGTNKIQWASQNNGIGYCLYCPNGAIVGTLTINTNTNTYTIVCDGILYGNPPTLPSGEPLISSFPGAYPVQVPFTVQPPVQKPSPFVLPPIQIIYGNITITSSSTSSGSCFTGSETLVLENSETVTMEDVQVDDKVLVASLDGKSTFYSPVMVLPHAANSVQTTFTQISTVSGRDIKMTADHLVMGGVCGSSLSLVQVGSLKIGECVQTVSGEEVVSFVSVVIGEGIYTVVPMKDALLVVNGVIASPFAVNHLLANSFYNIHRFVHGVVPSILRSSFINKVLSAFGELVAPAATRV